MNEAAEGIVIAMVFLTAMAWAAGSIATKKDKAWLPSLIIWSFVAKLFGAWARYYMVTVIYAKGDSFSYHRWGGVFANVWRAFEVPVSSSSQPGTAFTEVATGFVFAPYVPSMLGGFLMFATIAFVGQLLFYAAFRRWMSGKTLKAYAIAVLLLPSLVFWPASIGKDALMVFFLGIACYGASRLLESYQLVSLVFVAPGLFLAASIRSHVASVLGLAIVLAIVFGKPPKEFQGSPKRAIMIGVAVLGAAFTLATFSTTFGVTLEGGRNTQDPQAFLADVSEQTATGGSEISGGAVSNPINLPWATVTVLFRPLIYEAGGFQTLLSALEGTTLLAILLWKFPTIWRNKGLLREKPYLMLCFFYTGGFVVGFSAVLNLGILARQRVQVLPMFLAVLIGLGWEERRKREAGEPQEEPEETVREEASPRRVSRKILPDPSQL